MVVFISVIYPTILYPIFLIHITKLFKPHQPPKPPSTSDRPTPQAHPTFQISVFRSLAQTFVAHDIVHAREGFVENNNGSVSDDCTEEKEYALGGEGEVVKGGACRPIQCLVLI
ncbi:unnamed protein product [Periconia digitata]|uniref:Uncharacterized protein n=1 Tax=Periconia digitata TaxID=1303443 RepID=A0A9W4U424_9PLEO|nr:unnamed protein product [Periconia digitata]